MSDGEILRINPKDVATLFAEGKMQVVATSTITERKIGTDGMIERAKDILGQDFLGLEAVRNMEAKLRSAGQNVEFNIPKLPSIPYTEKDLELAKQNGEMLVLRVAEMHRLDSGSVGRKGLHVDASPITLINFRELFRKDPLEKLQTPFYSFKPTASDWYKEEPFAIAPGEINLGWAIVTKDVLLGSTGKKWNQQTEVAEVYKADMMGKGASMTDFRRRTATEATWDTMLYYVSTGRQLLSDKVDWTKTQTSDGLLVGVGDFDSDGLRVGSWSPDKSHGDLGVVLSR